MGPQMLHNALLALFFSAGVSRESVRGLEGREESARGFSDGRESSRKLKAASAVSEAIASTSKMSAVARAAAVNYDRQG